MTGNKFKKRTKMAVVKVINGINVSVFLFHSEKKLKCYNGVDM
jgi:hypothetical protein